LLDVLIGDATASAVVSFDDIDAVKDAREEATFRRVSIARQSELGQGVGQKKGTRDFGLMPPSVRES
jgi:hypothetical protein